MKKQGFSNEQLKRFDLFVILKFLFLCVAYGVIAFYIRNIILTSIENSPLRRLGNQYISLYEVHNTGAAFSLLQNQTDLLIGLSVLAVIIIVLFVIFRSVYISSSTLSAIAFLNSGIILNLIDRYEYGYVIDFIKLGLIPIFPEFCIADIMIVAGAVGICAQVFKKQDD